MQQRALDKALCQRIIQLRMSPHIFSCFSPLLLLVDPQPPSVFTPSSILQSYSPSLATSSMATALCFWDVWGGLEGVLWLFSGDRGRSFVSCYNMHFMGRPGFWPCPVHTAARLEAPRERPICGIHQGCALPLRYCQRLEGAVARGGLQGPDKKGAGKTSS